MIFIILAITVLSSTVDALVSNNPAMLPIILQNLVYTVSCSLFCAALLVLVYARLCTRYKLLQFLVFFALVFLGVYLGMSVAYALLHGRLAAMGWRSLLVPMIFGAIASSVMTMYSILNIRVEEKVARLRAAAEENEQLKRLESEARLASLQAKLNPHFLFNTLNSLAALVYDDPEKAENGIIKLSEVYRHVLSISNRQSVSLAEEVRLIHDYLELERLRFEEKLSYSIDLPPGLAMLQVPGLLMEPLVSNVIKHGLEKTDQPVHIDISISSDTRRLTLSVIDNGPGFDAERVSRGYGHLSIQERLALLYGDDFTFILHSAPGKGVKVEIAFPLPKLGPTLAEACL